ncbi:polyprenyl synthetase family protein [Alphaproteobacteria bacterium]|nr:polyprenyl synthetase family protein [Alphaproteobacteria bacterium]
MQNEIKNLLNISKKQIEQVNDIIIENMQSDIPLIPELAGYLINAGGKRIRPILVCVSYGLFKDKQTDNDINHIPLYSACVEFIHTATLLHDDVVDESDLRRGQKTAHNIWGNQAAVLVGDFLFSRAFQLMVDANNSKATKILANASTKLAEGEILQLLTTNNLNTTEDKYIEMISAKTAVLFSASCKIGALLAGANEQDCQKLNNYGENLGIAFQMIDDALDYLQNNNEIDKNIGDDFKEGKITMPLLKVLQDGNDDEQKFLVRCIKKMQQNENDLETMLSYINKYDAIEYTLNKALKYAKIAKQSIANFPNNDYKKALIEAVDYAVKRVK